MTFQRYRLFALLTCIGMFLVLIAGVLVTNTDSGRGCGTDWPLCNGKFVPAYTVESMVEYSHRMISGIVGLLVGATYLITRFWKPARRRENLLYAGGALLFTVMQAILGAMAVKWEQSSIVMALHFGISLFAFTCTWLLYKLVKRQTEEQSGQAPAAAQSGKQASAVSVPVRLYKGLVAVIVYCYGVVYLGAFIRHTSSGGACEGWPLCNGEIVPELSGSTAVAFAHRLAALLLFVLIAIVAFYVRKTAGASSELASIGNKALILVILQILSGGLLSFTFTNEDAYVFTGLLHTVIISALFSMLVLLAIRMKQTMRQ
ncbi:heme A synthase [Cohnella sp. CIP 111063]|uniref:COX15/CtaA family protein n=1 Tax=unclassified Cohnella TaxID=2636738 RepID=UPI000B8C55B9|nr:MULTISPECIES: COX15/CtaA family protein [unclassified Cohnella]OXS53299.1 heme A synthase [Cohnella sp. CIP 111063]PRX61034.1 cytochrome c oxidase assembly protein subunit 15 [Cohnella sp. SGD-V74]